MAVQLVDKGKDGNAPLAADLKEFDGLGLYAFGYVNEHDGAVYGHQRAVGILAEILVTRGVEDVDAEPVVVELHNAGGNGNTALLFNFHPVRDGMALGLAGFNRAGQVNSASV